MRRRRPPAGAAGLPRDGARRRRQLGLRPEDEHVVARGHRRGLRLAPSALAPLESVREHITVVSNTDLRRPRRSRRRKSAATTSAPAPCSSPRRIRNRRWARTCAPASRSTSSTPSASARRRPSRRCSCASSRSTRPAAARYRLLLRLHRLDQLGRRRHAAADDSRPAHRVRSAVRRRRHGRGAGDAAPGGSQHPRFADGIGRPSEDANRRRRPGPRSTTT